jgi:ubiquinone/menaquinone biosynthesis C-methylase UbiE
MDKKFDVKKLEKLNNPQRLEQLPPAQICEFLDLGRTQIAVDVGAGTGFFTKAFAEELPKAHFIALDTNKTMLNYMQENVIPSCAQIEVQASAESKLPLEEASADLVYMINLHHELEDAPAMIAECVRILRPGGVFFISDWKAEEMPMGPPLAIRIPAEKVVEQMSAAGVQCIKRLDFYPLNYIVAGRK